MVTLQEKFSPLSSLHPRIAFASSQIGHTMYQELMKVETFDLKGSGKKCA